MKYSDIYISGKISDIDDLMRQLAASPKIRVNKVKLMNGYTAWHIEIPAGAPQAFIDGLKAKLPQSCWISKLVEEEVF